MACGSWSPRTKSSDVLSMGDLRRDLEVCMREAVQESFAALSDRLIDDVRRELRGELGSPPSPLNFSRNHEEEEGEVLQERLMPPLHLKGFSFGSESTRLSVGGTTLSKKTRPTQFRLNGHMTRNSLLTAMPKQVDRLRISLFPSRITSSAETTHMTHSFGLDREVSRELTTNRDSSTYTALTANSSERNPLTDGDLLEDGGDSTGDEELVSSAKSRGSGADTLRHRIHTVVDSHVFEHWIGLVVVINALVLGIETDLQSSGGSGPILHFILNGSETVFCLIFLTELGARIYAYRWDFFLMESWAWNYFDLSVVSLQVTEQCVNFFAYMNVPLSVSFMRMLRVLRLVRITRLVRLVRLVEELGTIMSSILASLTALFWTLLLLVMLIYIVSVVFTQILAELPEHTANAQKIQYWYGRLPRSLLTMFEVIAGGVSWDEVVTPLTEEVSPVAGVIFSLYIAFCVFAMLNMATGVFVDRAIRKAQEDTDTSTAARISNIFFSDMTAEGVTFTEFNRHMDTQEMQDYFKSINVDPSEARSLFELLDSDGSGTIDAEELVHGCLRLRGTAKALELQLLVRMTHDMHNDIIENHRKLSQDISHVMAASPGARNWMRPNRDSAMTGMGSLPLGMAARSAPNTATPGDSGTESMPIGSPTRTPTPKSRGSATKIAFAEERESVYPD